MGCKAAKPAVDTKVVRRARSDTSRGESEHSPHSHGSGLGPSLYRKSTTILHSRLNRNVNINDRYEITEQIVGTGINGAVRIAKHKITQKLFAVKTLSLEGIKPRRRQTLHNEVSVYLQLDHPNIAKLIEVFEDNDKAIHLIMELCTGKELYDRLASKKKYSEADAKKVTREMLSAVNYCHKLKICHRDLKLENWVYATLDEAAPLKLIDFGFSRFFNPGVPMTAMHGTVYYVSPEVMEGCYAEKCDIWSIGVIVYMLLSGSPPFNGKSDVEILGKIKRGGYSLEGPRWEGITDEAKFFIQQLLLVDPDKRPQAIDALNHPWLSRRMTEDVEIDPQVLQNMRRFAATNHLKRAALGLIALSMTTKDVSALEQQFKCLDTDNTGTITMNDLAKALTERLGIAEDEIEAVFRRMDQTGDQQIHYSEFLASTLQARIFFDNSIALEAFEKFDVDATGKITVENLRAVLGDSYNGITVEDLLKSVDSKGTGGIDFETFLATVTGDTEEDFYHGGASCDNKRMEHRRTVDGTSQHAFSGAVTGAIMHLE